MNNRLSPVVTALRDNAIARVRKARNKGQHIPCLDSESLGRAIDSIYTSRACQCCGQAMMGGRGVVQAESPSLHKIRPELGYVAGNLAVVCFACNTAIGEAGTAEQVNARMAALRWQLEQIQKG